MTRTKTLHSRSSPYQKANFAFSARYAHSSIPIVSVWKFTYQVYAHVEHADALEAVYAETTRLAASEPGSIYYCICRDGDDPTVFHFFERYTGRLAFEEHNAQPIIQKLLKDRLWKSVEAKFVEAIKPAGL